MDLLTRIWSKVANLRLSLTQWAFVSMASIIGVLVGLLELRGSQLHKVQVQLLETNIKNQDDKDSKAVADATMAFGKAYMNYKANGGK